jgi:hypothetical protein
MRQLKDLNFKPSHGKKNPEVSEIKRALGIFRRSWRAEEVETE